MKAIITIIFLIIGIKGFSQTEVPVIILNFDKIELNQDSIVNNYKIFTNVLEENVSFERINNIYFNEQITVKNNIFVARDNYIYIPFYSEDFSSMVTVKPNDIVALSIIKNNQQMNIYFRFDRYIGIDQYLELNNLQFVQGDYFYDMCDVEESRFATHINSTNQDKIDLSDLKAHKIIEVKLNEILLKNKCNE